MSEIVDRFCDFHFRFNGIERRRQLEQRAQLAKYERWLDGKPIEETGAEDLRGYMDHLLTLGLHPNTVRTYRNMIRPFYWWAWENGTVSADTLLRIRAVPLPRGAAARNRPRPYNRRELSEFYKALDARWPLRPKLAMTRWFNGTSSWRKVWRHYMHVQIEAIVALALYCGLRRHEIYQLSLDDVSPDNAYLPIVGKGSKLREVPYPERASAAVQAWLTLRKSLDVKHDSLWLALIRPHTLKPMRFERFSSLMTTMGPYTLHRFRHTFATERLRAGMKLEKLQRIMGHASIEDTLIYTELVNTDLQRAMDETDESFASAVGRAA
jgi:site-specific recombinase XerD